jgi:glutathione S-transferase
MTGHERQFLVVGAWGHIGSKMAIALAALHRGISDIDHFIDPAPWTVGSRLSIADSAITPVLNAVNRVSSAYDIPGLISRYSKLDTYWNEARVDPVHARVISAQLAAASE